MATLIPAIGSSAFDSTGERRLAERLEQKLDADYLLWHNVPIGPKQTHPDFVELHARRGFRVLETKDERPKIVINPQDQARHCAIQVATMHPSEGVEWPVVAVVSALPLSDVLAEDA